MRSGEELVGVDSLEFEHRRPVDEDLLEDNYPPMDQSSFAGDLGETRLGESHLDDDAAAYEDTLTPDALIKMRKVRRQVRSLMKEGRGPADLFLQSVYSTALATPNKERDDEETPGTKTTL